MKTITITWSTEDVLTRAEELEIDITEEQADQILEKMDREHDATIGINWDVIDTYLYDIK